MPFRISADQAARHIIKGLSRGASEVHFPATISWLFKLLRIIPYPIYEWLIRKQVYAKGRKLDY
jgi:hypothetical protein